MVGHTVQFSTTASGLNLAPGDYIKVETEASPYDPALTGTVDGSGNITSATEIPDGTYTISYFSQSEPEVTNEERGVEISNQRSMILRFTTCYLLSNRPPTPPMFILLSS